MRPLVDAVFAGFVVFITAMAGVSFLATKSISSQKETVRDDLRSMAQAASGLVNGDLHEKLTDPSQQGGPEYLQALEPLVQFQRGIPDIAYLYTFVEKNGELHFVLDTATAAGGSKAGRLDQFYAELAHGEGGLCLVVIDLESDKERRGNPET